MKTIWSARVHTSGTKIQLLKNGSVTKVIKASDDTFDSKTAQTFAQNLVSKMNTKFAKQMTDPAAEPSVDTKSEQQQESLDAAAKAPRGISPKEASAIKLENKNLKKKIAKLEKDAATERKARKGLAIAKTLVEQKKIANTESAIKDQVMKIVAMSNEEIGLLERKVAGLKLYDSIEDAKRASLRYARMSRLHRQAAEDAQLAGDEKLADSEDFRAARYDELSREASACACKDAEEQVKEQATGVDAAGRKTAADDDDEGVDDLDDDIDDTEDEFEDDNELIEDEEDMDVTAAAAIYRKIASDHRKKASEYEASGDSENADVEDEIADEAEQLASAIEGCTAKSAENEGGDKEAAVEGDKEAAVEGGDKEATVEGGDKEATVESGDKEAAVEGGDKEATVEGGDKEATVEGDKEAAVEGGDKEATTVEGNKEAGEDTENETSDDSDMDKDAGTIEDPLAALLADDDDDEVEDDIDLGGDMPSDDMITAALANEDLYEDEDETEDAMVNDEDALKEATDNGNKKVANEGYNKKSSYDDRLEQNPNAHDPQVREIEDMLWR